MELGGIGVAVLLLSIVGCGGRPAPLQHLLAFQHPGGITRIRVSGQHSDDTASITSPQRIDSIVAALPRESRGWENSSFETPPSGDMSAAFFQGDSIVRVLWIGHGFVAERGDSARLLHDVSAETESHLRALLGPRREASAQLSHASDPRDSASAQSLRQLLTGTWHVVRDTAEWDCGGNGGRFGRLYHDSTFVDSIDLSSGYTVTPKGILFAPVHADSAGGDLSICPDDPIMWNGRSRRPLKQILPYYDAGFPGWLFADSALLYWGFVHYRAYAVRYDLRTARTDTTFLVEDTALFATDNRFQFAPPDSIDSTYVFDVFQKTRFTLDRRLRLLKASRQ